MKSNYLGLRIDLNVIFPELSVNSTLRKWREAMLIKNAKEVNMPSYPTMIQLCTNQLQTRVSRAHPTMPFE